jgi:uncharacterized membrane protein
MTILLVIIGLLLGAFVLNGYFGSILTGGILGFLAAWIVKHHQRLEFLRDRLKALQEHVDRLDSSLDERAPAPKPKSALKAIKPRPREVVAGTEPVLRPKAKEPAPHEPPQKEPGIPSVTAAAGAHEQADVAPRPAHKTVATPAPRQAGADLGTQAAQAVRRWFTTGNVPVKVGMIVSLFGVAFLIKEGVDRGWLVFPIELRLLLVAAFGIALLIIGWHLRERRPVYSLTVQGGGIAIIYLTTFAAFRLYALLPPLPALAMLIVVTLAAGTLAVLQDSKTLILLAIVGGFVAPVLVSSGQGSHVVLFSYYAILNAAVFGVSWFRAWRVLNVLGFLFTFVIGTLWGYLAYSPDRLATTEPFLVLFVLMYIAIPVLFASRQPAGFQGYVDGTLVFGTPLVGFGLQTQLVGNTEYGLAISAIALAAIYVGLATFLFKRRSPELRTLTESFLGLGIVFLAIAVPLALNARWTSVAWAMQGAGMIWLGMRQDRLLALGAGLVLQFGAAAAYLLQPDVYRGDLAVLNGYFLGAAVIGAAGFFSSWAVDKVGRKRPFGDDVPIALGLLIWGTFWWFDAGVREIFRFVPDEWTVSAGLAFTAITVWVALIVARQLRWQKLESLALLMLPVMAVGLAAGTIRHGHPLAGLGWLAWPLAFGTHYAFLRMREAHFATLKVLLHTSAFWLLAAVLLFESYWWLDRWTDGIWAVAGCMGIAAAMVQSTTYIRTRLPWPVGENWPTYHGLCAGVLLAALCATTVVMNVVSPGDPAPLPYLPLLNPLELLSLAVVLLAYGWFRTARDYANLPAPEGRESIAVPAAVGLFLLTMVVSRTVHHLAGVPFDPVSLAQSNVLQASLSVVWGSTALAGMVVGARRANRLVWFAGAVLMSAVVVKLFLVELGNTGTVTRIVSFLAVGVLLLIVGYLAPAPPRDGGHHAPT